MRQARIPNPQEFKRLLTLIEVGRHNARNRLAVMLSYYGGLRACEIAALKVTDVIDGQGGIKDQVRLKPDQTKGGRARAFYVGKRLQAELSLYIRAMPTLAGTNRPLLASQKGGAFSANTMVQLLCGLYGRAGIGGASSHSGRRSFITELAQHGISLKVIMTLAGHQNMSTTQHYIEVNDALLRGAVDLLD